MPRETSWWDTFRIWTYSRIPGPLDRERDYQNVHGAGITQPDIPDIRGDNSASGDKGLIKLSSSSNEMVDLSSVTNRQSRYKEYERLRNVAEVENCMTVFADEACIHKDTKIATPFGYPTIEWLTKNRANDRFLVYCWDFDKKDYTLGWAFNPRKVKDAMTYRVTLDDGSKFITTEDHKILTRDSRWVEAGSLKYGDELMPFYKLQPNSQLSGQKTNQFPRIFSFQDGWTHERLFVEKWKKNGNCSEKDEAVQKIIRAMGAGINVRKICDIMGHDWKVLNRWLRSRGFSTAEIKSLYKEHEDRRRVLDVEEYKELPVYDLSVEHHRNFCTDTVVMHNCQKGDNGHVCKITVDDHQVLKEAEHFIYKIVDIDRHCWNWFKNLCIYGDGFFELIMDVENPTNGIIGVKMLPPDSMYRIETIKGRLVEFQQSREGPDYQSLTRVEVTKATDADLAQATAIRFAPDQIVHMRLNEDRKTFYPYGVSLIEPARGPAHQLRMIEDAMMVYRLCLVGDTRIRTENGYKKMKDLQVDDTVFTCNKELKCEPTKVLDFIDNGIQDVYRVKSKHVEIVATKTHPILVKRDGIVRYVDVKDLEPGRDLFILFSNRTLRKIKISEVIGEEIHTLPEFIDEKIAKAFGFYCGRGRIYKKLIKENEELKDILVKANYRGRIPTWVFESTMNIRRAFMEGLARSIGHRWFSKSGRWYSTIATKDKEFIEDIKELWTSIGLCSGHIKTRNKKTISYAVTINDQLLPRFEEVLSIEYAGKENVYDITVDHAQHNFIANGIPVHNTRAPERRIFYIDVGQIQPHRAEAFMDRMKNQFRKRKTPRTGGPNALSVEERWHAPSADEDYWVPMRPGSNTRIETLPGAQNLGEIDDVLYFRNKLYIALNFPKNYFNQEDIQQTRITLSAQDVRFARLIERIQSPMELGLWQMITRHLSLCGFPEDVYEDLTVKMTPPSDWRRLSRAEVTQNMLNEASTYKSSQLMADIDIYQRVFDMTEDEAKEIQSRMTVQKLQDLKLQIIANNPALLGVGMPGTDQNPEVGTEQGGPTPDLMPQGNPGETAPPENPGMAAENTETQAPSAPLPEPSEEDIKKYDLEIRDYSADQDLEDTDYSEL